MILLGTFSAWWYLWAHRRSVSLSSTDTTTIILLAAIAALLGGKLLYYLETPLRYIRQPWELVHDIGHGFVGYGSLVASTFTVACFLVRRNVPVRPALDLIAICGCITHWFGKLGCLLAGCCYGCPTDSSFALVFSDPLSAARPLRTPLVPVQLIDLSLIASILLVLLGLRSHPSFPGQLILLYGLCYSAGRFVTEYYRGDAERGFVFHGTISHSQAVAVVVVAGSLVLWRRWKLTP